MKKVILTGCTGLIGKETIEPLKKAGFKVHCITSQNCNLFDYDAVNNFFKKIKPQYLLHFAWITRDDYLMNPINRDYVDASINMLKAFVQNDGNRAVFAGTCFEYDFKDSPLKETDSLNPRSLYAQCKVDLHERAGRFCSENGISFGWGRIFYVYGHNEKEGRLMRYIIDCLKNNEVVTVKFAQLNRDYMYTKDIASAFVDFLNSNVTGSVNICTGKGITLGSYAEKIATFMNKRNLLELHTKTTEQPISIIGDNTRLVQEVGFSSMYSYDEAIKEILLSEL